VCNVQHGAVPPAAGDSPDSSNDGSWGLLVLKPRSCKDRQMASGLVLAYQSKHFHGKEAMMRPESMLPLQRSDSDAAVVCAV
jgi:hypothetical protein